MTDWQTTYKTKYEQRLRDQYDPATGERLMGSGMDWQDVPLQPLPKGYIEAMEEIYSKPAPFHKGATKGGWKHVPCFNLDLHPDSPFCGICGQRHGIPEPKQGGDDADVCFRCGVSEWKHSTNASHVFLSNRKFQRWSRNKYV